MIVLLLLVAVIASVTIIAAKALSTLISESILQGKLHVMNPVFWVSLIILPITTVTQIRFLNRVSIEQVLLCCQYGLSLGNEFLDKKFERARGQGPHLDERSPVFIFLFACNNRSLS